MESGTLAVWIDGACEITTGTYGMVIKENGHTILATSGYVGTGIGMSNNVAEYSGLIAFLEWLGNNIDKAKKPIHVYSDSQLLVNQVNGKWRALSGSYIPYYNKAMALIAELDEPKNLICEWIPREKNEEADRLSKQELINRGIVITEPRIRVKVNPADQPIEEHSCLNCEWSMYIGQHLGCYAEGRWQTWLKLAKSRKKNDCSYFENKI